MECRIRRYERNLISSATAVVLFSLWDGVKTLFSYLTGRLGPALTDVPEMNGIHLTPLILLALTAIFLLIQGGNLYIAIHARREADGQQTGCIYLILTAIAMMISVWEILESCMQMPDELILYVLAEMTQDLAYAQILICGTRLRKLRKQTLKEGETYAG